MELEYKGLKSSNVWDYENGFYWFSNISRVNKLLAHYELYKNIVSIPGDIFELGVYKGASLVRFATFRHSMENDFSRKITAFDAFGAFPTDGVNLGDDLSFIERFEGAGGHGLELEELQQVLDRKGFRNIDLVKGNVFDTLPQYLEKHPETRISLLHLDMDVMEPTTFALDLLYDRVVPGGLIVFDDYGTVAGETIAVDQFLADKNLKIQKTNFYKIPAYIQKVKT